MDNNLLIILISSGVFFLLIEVFTNTLYGLSLSLASFLLALYVYITGDTQFSVLHGLILVILSTVFAYFFPKWLIPKTPMMKTGVDQYIGNVFKLEQVGNDWKVKIDGVDYLVDEECVNEEFKSGQKILLEGHKSGTLIVSVIK